MFDPAVSRDKSLRLVGGVSFIKCSKCKIDYIPMDDDISLNGSLYYLNCKACRAKILSIKQKYLAKLAKKNINTI